VQYLSQILPDDNVIWNSYILSRLVIVWLAGWLACWLVGWFIDWLVGWAAIG